MPWFTSIAEGFGGLDSSRREWLRVVATMAVSSLIPERRLSAAADPDYERLVSWSGTLRAEGVVGDHLPLGPAAVRTGELARGSPYQAFTLERYIRAGGSPRSEPLTLSLTQFDCVTLVEACLAVPRVAALPGQVTWGKYGREIERMRYRHGVRKGYSSRLHYFSEWISDGERRGLVTDLGAELGGVVDDRPLRFMSEHRKSYPALADPRVLQEVTSMEASLNSHPRRVIPTKCIPGVVDRIQTGDILGFATEIPGLDATHAALAHRGTDGALRVLHAPLSGGLVQISRTTLPEYVASIRHATGILLARPLRGPFSSQKDR
jgi:N-acetylmuramoyl-L-alanine amidase-like protein